MNRRPSGFFLSFFAMLGDAWREFLDAKILYLLLVLIGLLFGTALTGKIEPLPGGKSYLDLAARALAADLSGLDLAKENFADIAGRVTGSLYSISKAEPLGEDLPGGKWRVTLKRNAIPLLGKAESIGEIQERFGRIADGRLWIAEEVREEGLGTFAKAMGQQSWQMTVAPGPDLKLLWPNRFTLFAGSLELTPPKGAPLGLEVLILQKLLTTGLGGSILLLISVVVTAAFVPNMLRKGTLELLLVRPLPRWRVLVFKYIGSLLFVGALLGLLILSCWLVTGILADLWSPNILLAVPSLLLFFALLLSVSVFTGVLTRSATAAMLATVTYWVVLFIAGQMHNQVVESRLRSENAGKPRQVSVAESLRGNRGNRNPPPDPNRIPVYRSTVGRVAEGVYAVLPRTEDLDNLVDRQLMRDLAVAGPLRALVESGEFSWATGLGITGAHIGCFLLAACLIFSRRDP